MTGNWVPAGHTPPMSPSLVKLIRGEQMTPTELLEWADQLKGLGPYTLIPALAAALRRQIELTDQALVLLHSDPRPAAGQWLIDVNTAWEAT